MALLAKHWLTRYLVSAEITWIHQSCAVRSMTELVTCPGNTNGAVVRISSQYRLPFTTIALFTVWSWQLWLHFRSWASVTRLLLWSHCPNSFLHTSSIRGSWKKLHRTPSQKRTCWSSTISAEQDGLNGLTLSIRSRNLTPPLLLVLKHFSWRFLHVVSWLGHRFQYSLAGNNQNRIHQCFCDYQWVSIVSKGPYNEPSRGV